MYQKLSKIDALTFPTHHHLTPQDECFYLGDYTARAGFGHSATNDLVQNLKKPMDRKGSPQWKWKGWAIDKAASELRAAVGQASIEGWTYVPVPPSKPVGHPLYDDRCLQVLRKMHTGYKSDIRTLVIQSGEREAAHLSGDTRSPDALEQLYSIDNSLLSPRPQGLVVFDDVLVTGSSFVATKRLLQRVWPGLRVVGLFIARNAGSTLSPDLVH